MDKLVYEHTKILSSPLVEENRCVSYLQIQTIKRTVLVNRHIIYMLRPDSQPWPVLQPVGSPRSWKKYRRFLDMHGPFYCMSRLIWPSSVYLMRTLTCLFLVPYGISRDRQISAPRRRKAGRFVLKNSLAL